jgi:hypothetical protein
VSGAAAYEPPVGIAQNRHSQSGRLVKSTAEHNSQHEPLKLISYIVMTPVTSHACHLNPLVTKN